MKKSSTKIQRELTHERLIELVHYDPDSGVFTDRKSGRKIGAIRRDLPSRKRAIRSEKVYLRLSILGQKLMAHRVAVFYMTGAWPEAEVDPVDGNRLNLSYGNLKCCSNEDSDRWKRDYKYSRTAFDGKKWTIVVKPGGGMLLKKSFRNYEEAITQRDEWERLHLNKGG